MVKNTKGKVSALRKTEAKSKDKPEKVTMEEFQEAAISREEQELMQAVKNSALRKVKVKKNKIFEDDNEEKEEDEEDLGNHRQYFFLSILTFTN